MNSILQFVVIVHLVLLPVAYGAFPIGYIFHRSSGKLIHPLGGSANPADNTRLVVYGGGLGEARLQLTFEEMYGEGGFGYIKHVPSGKYVHPYGGSLNPGENTPLVYHKSKHRACLFKLDQVNEYIIHKGSGKIWHPYGGQPYPNDNTHTVLHSHRHSRARFYFGDNYKEVTNLILFSPHQIIGYMVHRSSGKLIHPLGGSANPAENTRLVVYRGGFGQSRLQLTFEACKAEKGFGYIKHVPSGKYVHPYGGSLNPGENTPLVYHSNKHSACLFKFDRVNEYIIHKGSGKIWHPYGGHANPGDNTHTVLHTHRHDSRSRFYFG